MLLLPPLHRTAASRHHLPLGLALLAIAALWQYALSGAAALLAARTLFGVGILLAYAGLNRRIAERLRAHDAAYRLAQLDAAGKWAGVGAGLCAALLSAQASPSAPLSRLPSRRLPHWHSVSFFPLRSPAMTTDALTPNPEVTAVACHATFTALLNCYIREFALADDGVRLCPHGDIPQALTSAQVAGEPLRLTLPASDCLLAITARRWSLLGRGDFDTVPFVKSFGRPASALVGAGHRPAAVGDGRAPGRGAQRCASGANRQQQRRDGGVSLP
ncbi:hypothetical protein O0544_18265 [Edwardsiella anguillarum]|nr:hypothetical protein [Edwardsiella anguillarum]